MFITHVLSLYDINSLERYAGSLKLSQSDIRTPHQGMFN